MTVEGGREGGIGREDSTSKFQLNAVPYTSNTSKGSGNQSTSASRHVCMRVEGGRGGREGGGGGREGGGGDLPLVSSTFYRV